MGRQLHSAAVTCVLAMQAVHTALLSMKGGSEHVQVPCPLLTCILPSLLPAVRPFPHQHGLTAAVDSGAPHAGCPNSLHEGCPLEHADGLLIPPTCNLPSMLPAVRRIALLASPCLISSIRLV